MKIVDALTKQDGKLSKSALLLTVVVAVNVAVAFVAFAGVWWVVAGDVTPGEVSEAARWVRDVLLGLGVANAGTGHAYSKDRTSKRGAA